MEYLGRCLLTDAVSATGKEDFQATLAFSAKRNIRLVIPNTDHDYMGKSTGTGTLSLWTLSLWTLALWTHHLKSIDLISEYSSNMYQDPDMKLGA